MSVALLATLGIGVANQIYGSYEQAQKDRELDALLQDRASALEGSRGDISTYFDELLKMSEQGFDLRQQSSFQKFSEKSLDIQTESDMRANKVGFASSGVSDAVTQKQLGRSRSGLEGTLQGLSLEEESDILGIEKGRTDRFAQLENELFNIETTRSQLDTGTTLGDVLAGPVNIVKNLFG